MIENNVSKRISFPYLNMYILNVVKVLACKISIVKKVLLLKGSSKLFKDFLLQKERIQCHY